MRVLFLDDSPERHAIFLRANPDAVQAWTHDEAIAALGRERFDVAFLDHDLNDHGKRSIAYGLGYNGAQELTGADVASFIAHQAEGARPVRVVVHSWNPWGADRMVAILRDAGVPVVYEPFQFPPTLLCGCPTEGHTAATCPGAYP